MFVKNFHFQIHVFAETTIFVFTFTFHVCLLSLFSVEQYGEYQKLGDVDQGPVSQHKMLIIHFRISF